MRWEARLKLRYAKIQCEILPWWRWFEAFQQPSSLVAPIPEKEAGNSPTVADFPLRARRFSPDCSAIVAHILTVIVTWQRFNSVQLASGCGAVNLSSTEPLCDISISPIDVVD
ncbi:hypothetical protein Fot_32562 [Forsythia ovata]|uniref:Uncharacterized protein n=1 Tax=Forsythia ovata TaxID=205694 RepID=A0ABD1T8A5_9LAMI